MWNMVLVATAPDVLDSDSTHILHAVIGAMKHTLVTAIIVLLWWALAVLVLWILLIGPNRTR